MLRPRSSCCVQRQILAAASALPEAASAQNTKHTFDKMTLNITDSDLDFRGDFMYFLLRLGCSQTARTGTSTSCASKSAVHANCECFSAAGNIGESIKEQSGE